MRKAGDNDEVVILASGYCPFCNEEMHILCDTDKMNEFVRIVDGRVVDILCKNFAHPNPWCHRFEQAMKSGKGWKWLWRKGKFQLDPTPLGEAMH